MHKIIPPIQQGQQGLTVANLQEALPFIVEKRQLARNIFSLAQRGEGVSGKCLAGTVIAVRASAKKPCIKARTKKKDNPMNVKAWNVKAWGQISTFNIRYF